MCFIKISYWIYKLKILNKQLIPVAVRSKVQVCGLLIAGIDGSNAAEDKNFRVFVLFCVGSGLYDELFTRSDFYWLYECLMCSRNLNNERAFMHYNFLFTTWHIPTPHVKNTRNSTYLKYKLLNLLRYRPLISSFT